MKIVKVLLLSTLLATTVAACTKVPAGNVGVKVYLLGGAKGVDSEEVGPGRYWLGFNQEMYLFPTFTQNYVWTRDPAEGSRDDESISFQTVEGMTVNADVGISYAIQPDMVNIIFQKYRKGVEEITDIYLRNMVRDALVTVTSSKPIESVYGAGKTQIISEVEDMVRSQVAGLGINIERIYWVGELRLPDNVSAALNSKIEATQRAQQRQNEVEEKKAEAQKLIEEARGLAESIRLKAEAEADANRLVSESLTDDLLRYEAIKKWEGSLPRFMGGSGPIPFVDVGE